MDSPDFKDSSPLPEGANAWNPLKSAKEPGQQGPCLTAPPNDGMSRRNFLRSAVAATGTAGLPVTASAAKPARTVAPASHPVFAEPVSLLLRINGRRHALTVEPRVTLLDALRETIGLNGTKKGCDRGQCGACTVLVNGRRINSCLTLAVMHDGEEITTVEGLASSGQLSPLQTAFIHKDAFQCGYCTPGQLCSATALLNELRQGDASAATQDVRRAQHAPTDAEIRERMSGNLCRCGAYSNIVEAIQSVVGSSALHSEGENVERHSFDAKSRETT